MKKKTGHIRRLQAAFLAALVAVCLSWAAADAENMNRTVELTAGQARTVDLGASVADILVANPDIADVGTMRSSRLYIVGKSVGETNVLAFDAAGNQLADIGVRVSVDDANLSDALKKFFPKEKIEAKTVKNDIVLTGKVSTPIVANRVRDLTARFLTGQGRTVVDLMNVQGDQQVMLQVKIVEAKRGILREYGFTPDVRANLQGVASNINGIAGIGLTQPLLPFAGGQLIVRDPKLGPLSVELRALERDGLINTLAEPNLTAVSGETAGFLAGGEFPIPSGQDSSGNIALELKSFGVSLNFTPTVLSEDHISLQLLTEVSEKSNENSVTLASVTIPGLTVRRAETTVQMRSGGTIMIAGLIKSSDSNNLSGFPGMKELPILGELFKSKSFTRDESELVILVTPYLVTPFADSDAVEMPEEVSGAATRFAPIPPPALEPQKHSSYVPAQEPELMPATPPAPVTATRLAPAPQPVAAAAPVLAAAQKPVPASENPLSRSFAANLRKVYGTRASHVALAGPSFGYIVD